MRTTLLWALVPTLAAVAACGYPKGGAVPPPVTGDAVSVAAKKWPDATEASLAEGRALFASKCNACHDHPDVNAVAAAKWPEIAKEMGEKAKLDAKQSELVLRFVLAAQSSH